MQFVICLLAVVLDRVLGDPQRWHPVIWIGTGIGSLETTWNRGSGRKLKGFLTVLIIVVLTTGIVFTVSQLALRIHIGIWIAVEVGLITLALAQKSLHKAASVVSQALAQQDLQEARTKLGWIVGRDTHQLPEPEIARGVIETVSENTGDGVTAPLFYALLFGATGAWCYKAINTLDSMIGYKNERYGEFGYAAAKLDDMVNFIPSRLTGLLIILCTKAMFKQPLSYRLQRWLEDAKKHPSPNSGYLEAATAMQLGIRLGGLNYYQGQQSFRAYMGDVQIEMNRTHIDQAVQHMYRVTLYVLLLGGVCYAITSTWG